MNHEENHRENHYDFSDPRRCKTSSVGQGADCQSRGRRFDSGQNSENPRTQIYIDLRYIDPQAKVLNYCFK